jgi:NDP-sugar pyrophosphorylase family protein
MWVGPNTSISWESSKIVGPVYIGSSVKIEPGCSVIGPARIGHGSHLCKRAKVIHSVLFEYTRIGETTYVGDDRCQLRWGGMLGARWCFLTRPTLGLKLLREHGFPLWPHTSQNITQLICPV